MDKISLIVRKNNDGTEFDVDLNFGLSEAINIYEKHGVELQDEMIKYLGRRVFDTISMIR